jgi:hypothetical protein
MGTDRRYSLKPPQKARQKDGSKETEEGRITGQ